MDPNPTDPELALADAVGASATVEEQVEPDMTATAIGSGDVPVLATPVMLILAERAAVSALAGLLPHGWTTVGASVQLDHLAPTPVWSTARVSATVLSVEGRRVIFDLRVYDEAGEVARGTHVRVVVDRAKFEVAASARRAPDGL